MPKKKKSILKGQKPRRKKNEKSIFTFPFYFIAKNIGFVLILAISLFSYHLFKTGKTLFEKNNLSKNPKWEIEISKEHRNQISKKERDNLERWLDKKLNNNKSPTLYHVAKMLQNKYSAKETNIIQNGSGRLFVNIKKRKPILLILADRIRMVSEDGTIYLPPSSDEENKLPLITGVFPKKTYKYKIAADNSLVLEGNFKKLLEDAITLYNAAKSKNIAFQKINYIEHRGFVSTIKNSQVEVSLGPPPFLDRIDRLVEILINLNKKGIKASRIELDYDNKAFIKEIIL